MNEVLITICIPAYNAAKFIGETLESIRKQTYRNWELVVVEDGSADDTESIVNSFKKLVTQKVTYFRQEMNLGLSATRNTCVSFATGEWIALLDSDDLWYEDHLAGLINTAVANPDCTLIHSEVSVFDSQTGKTLPSERLSQQAINQLPNSLFDGSYSIQPSTVMITTKLYEMVGGFNPNLRYVEDIDMWFRCARAGSKFAFTGRVSCYYRKHAEALSSNSAKMSVAVAHVFSMHFDWEDIPKSIRARQASNAWLSAARIIRKTNKDLAKQYLSNSTNYQKTLKQLRFWLILQLDFNVF